MMNNRSHFREEPIVRNIPEYEDILRDGFSTKSTPACRNERANTRFLDGVEYDLYGQGLSTGAHEEEACTYRSFLRSLQRRQIRI